MKALFVGLSVLGAASVASGSPADRVALAALRLAEQRSYGWTTAVIDDARNYTIQGKTERGSYTWVRLPMVPAIARRLGREADVEIEAWFRGPLQVVIRTDRGWRTLKELPTRTREWRDDVVWSPRRNGRPLGSATEVGLIDPTDLPPVVLPQGVSFAEDADAKPYCNAQFGLAQPHEELAVIVSSHVEMRASGDVVTGTLTDTGAQLLLVRDGQEDISPLCAAGTFKLLLKNGAIVSYLLRLEGILKVDRRKVRVRQASSTTLSEIGGVRLNVPEEVRRKLGD